MKHLLFYLCFFFVCSCLAHNTATTSSDSVAYIKIRKGIVSFKKNIPPEDVRVYISVKMQNEKDGNYKVSYRKGSTNMYDLEKKKWTTAGAAIAEVLGGIIVLTLTVLSVASHF